MEKSFLWMLLRITAGWMLLYEQLDRRITGKKAPVFSELQENDE
jgi:hypothetical protein